jgi:hypothetical protein
VAVAEAHQRVGGRHIPIGLRVQSSRLRVLNFGFSVQGSGFRVLGFGFGVQGLGFGD